MKINWLAILKVLNKANISLLIFLLFAGFMFIYKADIGFVIRHKVLQRDRIVTALDNDVHIANALQNILIEYKADRSYIFRFHNGVTYYNGTHKNKFSCDYEVVRKGTSRQATYLQDIPVTLFPTFIREVNAGRMSYEDIKDIDDLRVQETLAEQGIKGLVVVPYRRDGNLFAMIGVDYINTTETISTLNLLEFKRKAKQIGNMLL
jgi:hypothetical protein